MCKINFLSKFFVLFLAIFSYFSNIENITLYIFVHFPKNYYKSLTIMLWSDQCHRNIVVPAPVQRIANKTVAAIFRFGIEANVKNIQIVTVGGKPIRTQQYLIPRVKRQFKIIGSHRFLGAYRAGYLVTLRVCFQAILGDLAPVEQLLNVCVVLGYLADTLIVPLGEQVIRARVADVHYICRSAENYRCDTSRAHNLVDLRSGCIPHERVRGNNGSDKKISYGIFIHQLVEIFLNAI